MPFLYAVPVLSLALVVWAVGQLAASRPAAAACRWSPRSCVACGTLTLVRTDGVTGDAASDFAWRWTPTAEERLLAQEPVAAASPPAAEQVAAPAPPVVPAAIPERPVAAPGHVEAGAPSAVSTAARVAPSGAAARTGPAMSERDVARAEWPAFAAPSATASSAARGSRPTGSRRRRSSCGAGPIGPGWSSFAVPGDRIFTQEQRGDDEIVSAYSLKTGEPVWRHRDPARFWESNAGAGPRATPTLSNGRVYTLGATGILNALDARDGSVVWSRNAAADTGRTIPDWGISSSPLVVGDVVIAATAGTLAAYDAATGTPRWVGPKGGWGYSSPHLCDDRRRPADRAAERARRDQRRSVRRHGALEARRGPATASCSRRCSTDGDLLIGSGSGLAGKTGMLRVSVKHGASDGAQAAGGWNVKERWTSTGLKPYFNDFVVHQGHAFGFDGSILACIDLEDGKRKWKGGRYGNGQLVLLARSGPAAGAVGGRRAGARVGDAGQVHGARAIPGDRRQDLEPPGAGRRRPAGSQRRGDGRVPALPIGAR